jgi:hypothetical protein
MDGFRPLKKAPAATALWVAALVGLWAATWRGAVSNWHFALISVGSLFIVPRIIMSVFEDRFAEEERAVAGEDLDLIGIDRAFRASDRQVLDTALGLPVAPIGGGE